MANLIELSRTQANTGSHIVVEDYTKHFRLCRYGVWVGLSKTFVETVTISYEHTEQLYVGWIINGTVAVNPGYGPFTPPWGAPTPGASQVTYTCPVGEYIHRISFASTSGMPDTTIGLQVIYRLPGEANAPYHYGPFMNVKISGSEIEWPEDKLKAERDCLRNIFDKLKRYVIIGHVHPGDPVEMFENVPHEEWAYVKAQVDTLENIDHEKQRELADAIKANLTGFYYARMPATVLRKSAE